MGGVIRLEPTGLMLGATEVVTELSHKSRAVKLTNDGAGTFHLGVATEARSGHGLSTSYDESYPPELEEFVSQEEYLEAIQRINRGLTDRFPCGPCRLQAYCCCPCTLGLSLLSIRKQANEIEKGAGMVMGYVNDNLAARGRDVRFDLKRKCCQAWVQVEYGLKTSEKPDMVV